ncbi:bifunctional metallophosphatase/5'-nucleotidase [candidate division KSB3 bacterium]|uniref:Bifunctional metallophosphatase/5'-nucleotidase n=1 Tax=candidate division KSB3 bacterium TaxID=2044937 RepID=A0A9D5JYF7_9BACT|nr:bifunctional metallophosphatase/5'-nucleotidase [candidate division KSB3 bacterium]MBD3326679.1 bifunctional metallophosphatase/5'-nucleotidase [candidate division KSB3 bacterium]
MRQAPNSLASRLVSLIVIVVILSLSGSMAAAKTVKLKIIETSDIHGSFFPYDFIQAKEVSTSLAQISTYVKKQRAKPDQHVILVDNGDILQGQPTVYYYNFEKTDTPHICAQIMNFMHYDLGVVGNHDIEAGHAVYDKLVEEFQFPWLAANAVKTEDGQPYFEPYTVIEKDGITIAVLGLITPWIPHWLPENLWEGMAFEDMIATSRKWVQHIQEHEQPDLLIGVFHAGVDYTYKGMTAETPNNENASQLVAEQVPGFDVIFVGHDHAAWNETVTNSAGEEVHILGPKDAAENAAVAAITMTYDETQKTWTTEIDGQIITVRNYPADEEFMAKFSPVVDELKAYVDKPIGRFTKTISTRDAMFGDSAFVDLIHRIQLELTGADVSFAAPLSFNAMIEEGEVFVRDMFKLYKYENLLYTMALSGQEIKDALEYSYGNWFDQMTGPEDHLILFKKDDDGNPLWKEQYRSYATVARYYNYDSAAGINYTVDVSKPAGERITIDSLADGTPFDLEKQYKVAVNSYRGTGGGGHLTTGAGIPKEELSQRLLASTIKDLRYFLMKWIEQQEIVTPEPLGNWEVVPTAWWEQAKKMDYSYLYYPRPPERQEDGPRVHQ